MKNPNQRHLWAFQCGHLAIVGTILQSLCFLVECIDLFEIVDLTMMRLMLIIAVMVVTLRRKSVRSMHAGGRPLPSCNEVHRKERIDKKNSTSGRGSPSAGASAAGAASPSVLILLTCLHSGIVTVSLVKLNVYF